MQINESILRTCTWNQTVPLTNLHTDSNHNLPLGYATDIPTVSNFPMNFTDNNNIEISLTAIHTRGSNFSNELYTFSVIVTSVIYVNQRDK